MLKCDVAAFSIFTQEFVMTKTEPSGNRTLSAFNGLKEINFACNKH